MNRLLSTSLSSSRGYSASHRTWLATALAWGITWTMVPILSSQVVWDGSEGTGDWSDGDNWDTGSLPGSADDVTFDAANANSQFSITLGATRTVRGLTFDATGSNGFTFNSGDELRVNAGGVTNNNTNTQTFDANFRVNSNQTWDAASGAFVFDDVDLARSVTLIGSSDVTINGTLTALGSRNFTNNSTGAVTVNDVDLSTNTSRRLTFTGTGDTTISGLISNAGDLRKQGTGTLTITGANTYAGESFLTGGTVAIGDDAAFGTGRVDLGNFTLESTGGARDIANDTRLTGSFRLGGTDDIELSGTMTLINNRNIYADGTGAYLISGGIELSNNTTNRRLTIRGANDIEISGDISNGASATAGLLTKNDAGTLTLSGTNTYDGITDMNAGTLIITGDNSGLSGQFRLDNGDVEVGAANAFGTGELRLANGDIRGDGTARTITNSQVTLAGNGTIIEGSSNIAFTGTMTVTSGNRTMTVNNTADTTFGDIALSNDANNRRLTLNGTGHTTIDGNITNGVGGATAGQLTINNTGTTTLNGSNSYGGITDINAGTVIFNGANTTTGDIRLDAGSTIQIGNDSAFGTSRLLLNSGTLQGDGTARSISNDLLLTNNTVTIGGTSDLDFNGTLSGHSNRTLTINNSGSTTFGDVEISNSGSNRTMTFNTTTDATIDGVVSNGGTSTASRLTKNGTATLTLTGENTYTGITTVNAGTLQIGDGGTSGSLTSDIVNKSAVLFDRSDSSTYANIISSTGTVEQAGTGNLTLSGNNTYTGTTTVSAGTLTLASNTALGNASAGTTVDLGATLALTNNITIASEAVTNNGTLTNTSGINTYGGVISGTGVVTTASGNLTLSNTNTYSGDTTVGSGSTLTLSADDALGTGSTTVASGGTLALTGGIEVAQTNYDLSGTGVGGTAGAIANTSGDNRLTGDFSLSAAATTQSATGTTLRLGEDPAAFSTATDTFDIGANTLTIDGAGDTALNAGLSGSGNLVKAGTGTLTVNGVVDKNTTTAFTGEVIVNDGELIQATLDNDAPILVSPGFTDWGINGNITVGDGVGTAGSARLTIGTNEAGGATDFKNVIGQNGSGDTLDLTVNSDGTFDTQGHVQYLKNVTLDGGAITTEYNSGAAEGTLFIDGNISSTSTSQTATIDGEIELSGTGQQISVVTDSTLHIDARITNQGFEKTGDGTLILSGVNSYDGATTISDGIVRVDQGLSVSNTALGTTSGGTSVASGAQLQLNNVLITNGEALTLNGAGISSDGALRATSGTNEWSGAINLASNSQINADTGATLTLSGTITGSNLTVGGVGNTTLSGANTYNTLTKQGTGTLTLSGATKTLVTTNVTAGNLTLASSNILDDGMDLQITGGNFNVAASITETIDTLDFDSGELNIATGGSLTIAATDGVDISGGDLNIDSTGILTMNGGTISGGDGSASTGTMILTAGNTLDIESNYDFGGTLELTAGTTLALSGGSTFDVGTLNVTGNTIIDFGSSTNNTLNLDSLTIAAGVTITVNNWVSFQDLWTTDAFTGEFGTVTIDERDNNTAQITFTGFSNSQTIWLSEDFGTNEITVPEPGSYGAILMGFGLAMWTLRRPRRKAA